MQESTYTGHVTRAEWRWVFLVSITLMLLSFAPFVIVAIVNPPGPDWQFMGALHDYEDSAASMARIRQGAEGYILVQFWHTPEPHSGALIHPIYMMLGQLSRITISSPTILFHLARMVVALLMYLSIYQLGASIWVKVVTRQIFFIIVSLGSGFGWLYAFFIGISGLEVVPDLMIPQAYPFYSASVNVHYPLTIMGLAIVASVMISVLRPGNLSEPAVDNEGLAVFLVSLMLAFVYPDALVPVSIAFVISVLVHWYNSKKITPREWRWGLWVLVPALPLLAYDLLTLANNPLMAEWIAQRGNQVPTVPMLLIGMGPALVMGLPALIRAVRRFEADGDRFMLLWLLAMVATMYLPLRLNQYFLAGMMLPLGYFATRAVMDFWFHYIKRRYRGRVAVVVVPLLLLTHLIWLFAPVLPILQGWSTVTGNVLEQGYVDAFEYLDNEIRTDNIGILAAPDVGPWIPLWTGGRPVYGHYAETSDSAEKNIAVRDWYAADGETCWTLLQQYHVRFVIVGPREQRLGAARCANALTLVAASERVNVYVVPRTLPPR